MLYPTLKEFEDFEAYVNKAQKKYKKDYGIVKVVPPKGWKARRGSYNSNEVNQFVLKTPIEQHVQGTGGFYQLQLQPKKSVSIKDFREKYQEIDKQHEKKSINELEAMFWKTITYNPPVYGADVPGGIMDANIPWSLAELPTTLLHGL